MQEANPEIQVGVDPTCEQWDELSTLIKRKRHHVFFDCAYQGFASGDAERDAYAIRKVGPSIYDKSLWKYSLYLMAILLV